MKVYGKVIKAESILPYIWYGEDYEMCMGY